MAKVPVLDLFSGAGGLTLAAGLAGAEVGLSVEVDPVCCETLRLNKRWHKGEVLEGDIRNLSGRALRKSLALSAADPLIVVGGAPCQPFSKAAYWTDPGNDAAYRRARARGEEASRPTAPLGPRPDERRTLIQEFWRVVLESKAHGFVFENVPSLLHPRNRREIAELQSAASAAGFHLRLLVANATDFGVAQKRQRVFLLASKARVPADPRPSTPRQKRVVTAGQAIAGFEGAKYHEPEEVVAGRWAEHLRTVPPGWNYKAHTAWAGHPNPTFETETRFWNFLLKLDPEQPSWTIAANPGPWTGPFHWDNRRLRTPELAALQGFPRGYKFAGTRRERVRQIGNAVPAPMGAAMIGAVVEAICGVTKKTRVA